MSTDLQLDITTTVARIEQAAALPPDEWLRDHLLDRLATCDAPRLRRYLDEVHLAMLEAEGLDVLLLMPWWRRALLRLAMWRRS